MKGGCAYKIDNQVLILWNLRDLSYLQVRSGADAWRKSRIETPTNIDGYQSPYLDHPTSLAFQPPSTLLLLAKHKN
jgi:hypothetical protein